VTDKDSNDSADSGGYSQGMIRVRLHVFVTGLQLFTSLFPQFFEMQLIVFDRGAHAFAKFDDFITGIVAYLREDFLGIADEGLQVLDGIMDGVSCGVFFFFKSGGV
jgi:hypothetical protein